MTEMVLHTKKRRLIRVGKGDTARVLLFYVPICIGDRLHPPLHGRQTLKDDAMSTFCGTSYETVRNSGGRERNHYRVCIEAPDYYNEIIA